MSQGLVESIYLGPIELSPWSTFLSELSQLYGGAATSLILDMPSTWGSGLLFSSNAIAAYQQKYIREFRSYIPFQKIPPNTAWTIDEIFERKEMIHTNFYMDLLKPSNTEYILGINIPFMQGRTALLTISRSEGQGGFCGAEKHFIESLSEHLTRALPIFFRVHQLTQERELFGDALDQLRIGAILLDRDGGFLHANATGNSVLYRQEGLMLRDGKLITGAAETASRLSQLIRDALVAYENRDGAHCGMLIVPAGGEGRLQILARPSEHYAAPSETGAPAVCLFVSSSDKSHVPSPDVIRELFGLTRTEGVIVTMLLAGLTPKEIAFKQDSSLATVRTHIKSIFAKAGVRRQAELMTAILRSVAPLA